MRVFTKIESGCAAILVALLCLLPAGARGQGTVNVDFSSGSIPSNWTKTGTVVKQTYAGKTCVQLQKTTSIASPTYTDVFSSAKIHLTRSSNGKSFVFSYRIGTGETVAIKTFTASEVTQNSFADYIVDIPTEARVSGCQFIFYSEAASYYVYSIEFTKVASGEAMACSAPVFSPADGTSFDETLTVTAGTDTEGAKVMYTTLAAPAICDKDFPAEGLTVSSTTTIRAIAVKPGLDDSRETTATYTKREVLQGLPALVKQIREDDSKDDKEYTAYLTGAVVTAVDATRQNAYMEEDGVGVLFYRYGKDIAYTAGQKLSGKAVITACMYSGMPEITSISGDVRAEDGAAIPCAEVTVKDIQDNYVTYEARRVKITGAEVVSGFASKNAKISQNGNELTLFDKGNNSLSVAAGSTVDVTGYPILFSGNSQLNVLAKGDISVTGTKEVATVSFSEEVYTVNIGGKITVNAVSDNPAAVVTYSVDAESGSLCTIDGKTGELTAGNTPGSVTVTATVPADDKYTGATATCTVNIKDPNATEVTDELTVGNFTATSTNYVDFSGVAGVSGVVYAGKTSNSNGAIGLRTANNDCGIVVTANKEGYRLKSIAVEWNSTTDRTIDVYGKSTAYSSAADLFDKAAAGDGIGSIVYGQSVSVSIAGDYPFIGIRSKDNALFINKLTLVWEKAAPATGSFTIGEDGYATYYSDRAYVMPEGAEGGIITAADAATGVLTVNYDYKAGATVPSGTALLLKGGPKEYAFDYTATPAAAPAGNMLHGADAVDGNGNTYVAGTNVRYYILSHNLAGDKYGFFWAAADGGAVKYEAPHAFLAVDFAGTDKVPQMLLLDGSTTGITSAGAGVTETGDIYTIAGMRVNVKAGDLPKGIYIVNGKKVVIR